MIDFHSHILPGIDDGSCSVEESIEMLKCSYQQGVRQIVATPHFYAAKDFPVEFLNRRNHSWEQLQPYLTQDMPKIHLGAEVYYFDGIGYADDLPKFCISGTNVLLLEMPFRRWTGRMVNDVISLSRDTDMTILLAHIDRYLSKQPKDIWDMLEKNGILFQVNASFFLEGWISRRKALKLLRDDTITAVGSDCHNMKDRRPNMQDAFAVIEKKEGRHAVDRLNKRANALLSGAVAKR